jgi:hypothetical protein
VTPDSVAIIPGLAALVLEAPFLILEELLLEWEGLQGAHHALVVRAHLADDLACLQDATELPTATASKSLRWRWALLDSQGGAGLSLSQ